MKTDIIIHKTTGRKTTNDALITLLRAGMIASIMMLVLGAGMATAFDNPRDGGESTDIQSAPLGVVRSASSYDPQAAVTYSDSWWDGKNGSYKYYYSYYWGGWRLCKFCITVPYSRGIGYECVPKHRFLWKYYKL